MKIRNLISKSYKDIEKISLIISSTAILSSFAYHYGLFSAFDSKLLGMISITDHVIYSLTIMINLIIYFLIAPIFILLLLLIIFKAIDFVYGVIFSSKQSIAAVDKILSDFLAKNAPISIVFTTNILLTLSIYFITPTEFSDNFSSAIILNSIISSATFIFCINLDGGIRSNDDLKLLQNNTIYYAACHFVSILMAIFMVGVLESAMSLRYISDEGHTRHYLINNKVTGHVLRMGSEGVYVVLRDRGKIGHGQLEFIPSTQIKEIEIKLNSTLKPTRSTYKN